MAILRRHAIWLNEGETVILDLNGYTWDVSDYYLNLNGTLSIYDTSDGGTGKIISTIMTIWMNTRSSIFNLYSGTVETTATTYAVFGRGNVNLYGGKIKSNGYAVLYNTNGSTLINLDGTVLECGEGYAHMKTDILNEGGDVIDVSDYTGDSLTVHVNLSTTPRTTPANIKIFEGIKNAEEAEKYNIDFSSDYKGYFLQKIEYNETTGEKYVCIVKNAFTQQPIADNNYTVDFNNPNATFQWYEIEETVLTDENVVAGESIGDGVKFENGKWFVSSGYISAFSYDAKAGEILKVSMNSDKEYVVEINTGLRGIYLNKDNKSGMVNIDSDTTLNISIFVMEAESPIELELEFSILGETAVNGETGKTLQSVEHKLYWCKATVDTSNYYSDIIDCSAHIPAYSASDNTIIGTCSLCNTVLGRIALYAPNARKYDGSAKEAIMDGVIAGVDAPKVVYKKGEEILTGVPVDAGTYTASITLEEATASVTFEVFKADMEITASGYTGTYDNVPHSITVNAPEGAVVEYEDGRDGEWSTTNPVFTNAGTYDVEYRVTKENYKPVTGKEVVTINLANMKVTAKGYTGTYDKASHSIKVTAPKGAKVEYRLSKNAKWSTKNPKFKDPSEKAVTVYYRVTMANYKAVEGSAKVHIKFNLKKGAAFTSGKYKYKITGTSTIIFTGITSSSMKKVTIPKTVKYGILWL